MKIAIIGSKGFDTLEFHLKDEFEFQKNEVKIFDLKNSILNTGSIKNFIDPIYQYVFLFLFFPLLF